MSHRHGGAAGSTAAVLLAASLVLVLAGFSVPAGTAFVPPDQRGPGRTARHRCRRAILTALVAFDREDDSHPTEENSTAAPTACRRAGARRSSCLLAGYVLVVVVAVGRCASSLLRRGPTA